MSGNITTIETKLQHDIKENREYLLNHVKMVKLEMKGVADEAKKMLDERPPPPPIMKEFKKQNDKASTLKRPESDKLSPG